MSALSWPRLYARLRRPQVTTLQGRWRTHEASGTFAHRAPDEWVTLGPDGRPSEGFAVQHLLRPEFSHGDYSSAAGPVREVEHEGRPAWQVDLTPPPHKRGLLTVTVDAATDLLVRKQNAPYLAEVVDLVVDAPLDDAVFAPRVEADRAAARETARYDLARRRPVPTPRWWPYRRGWAQAPDVWVVEDDHGDGYVARAPLGQEPAAAEWTGGAHVHRLDHGGWSWAVGSTPAMSAEDARRVVEQVVDLDGSRGTAG